MKGTTRALAMLLLIAAASLTVGCTKTFTIATPETSAIKYAGEQGAGVALAFSDTRQESEKPFNSGRLTVNFKGIDDQLAFLRENIEKEAAARGMNLSAQGGSGEAYDFKVRTFHSRNWRSSGFSAYWTFTTFSADFEGAQGTERIVAYYKMGKVPVWSFSEVEEPCYGVPTSLMIKEIVAKINRFTAGMKTPDAQVQELIAATTNLDPSDPKAFTKVFSLGFSNNPIAIPHLVELTKNENDMIASSAISSLGILGAVDQFEYLKTRYENDTNILKQMALKAIGDLATPESAEFLKTVKGSADYEVEEIKEIVDLYL